MTIMLDRKYCDYGQTIHKQIDKVTAKRSLCRGSDTKVLLKEFDIDCIVPEFESVCALLRWKKGKIKESL
jgi:uncharacterized protein (DUF1330 family)